MIMAPSLLAADFRKLAAEAERARRSGADWLHLDIMDGHFVPNISFGPAVVKALRGVVKGMFFDVHLMCSRPEGLLEPFAEAGADQLTVHVELGARVSDLLWKIKALGKKAGLAVNPPTPIAAAEMFVRQIDTMLIMTVNPGFGGQPFIPETLPKVEQARLWRKTKEQSFYIEVDGGINFSTVEACAKAGADAFVSGTGLFGHRNMRAAVAKMRRLAGEPKVLGGKKRVGRKKKAERRRQGRA